MQPNEALTSKNMSKSPERMFKTTNTITNYKALFQISVKT